ncbi:MAG TPA: single-stranded DNA-binding protein [Trebonia sp.]|nr:single-stranded DNA-binding protein [Trebonia sp.]
MSQENQITLRGYLTAEPKLYQKTPQAVPLTELRVGCTPRRLNHETGEWQDLPTSYYRVKCWRRLAINAVSSLHKGDQVLIRGRFYLNTWVDSQQRPRSALEIEADTLGHDLAYGWSHYLRGTRSSGNSAAVNSGEAARQDTEAPPPDDRDDEYSPDLEATGPDPSQAAVPPPGDQDGFTGYSQTDAQGTRGAPETEDVAGGQFADGEGGGSLEGDAGPLVRDPVPF